MALEIPVVDPYEIEFDQDPPITYKDPITEKRVAIAPQKPKAPTDVYKKEGAKLIGDIQKGIKAEAPLKRAIQRPVRKAIDISPLSFDTVEAPPYVAPSTGKWTPSLETSYPGLTRDQSQVVSVRDIQGEENEFQRRVALAEFDRETQKANAPDYSTQLVNRFSRGALSGGESMLKGISLLNKDAKTDPTTEFLYQSPQEKRSQYQNLLPVNQYDDDITLKLAESIGSSIPFLIGTAAGGPAGPFVASTLGAASNAGSTYDDAIANGADEQTARFAAVVGAVIGLSEGIGMGRLSTKGRPQLPFSMPMLARAGRYALETGEESVEEWGQETISQILNNANAKVVSGYDPNRAIQESVWENGLMGALSGGLMGGAFGGAGRLALSQDPEYKELKQIDKLYKEVLQRRDSNKEKEKFKVWVNETVGDRIGEWQEKRQVKENIGVDPKMAFDLLPSERRGQAPVLVAPSWFLGALLTVADPSLIGGLNIGTIDYQNTVDHIERNVDPKNSQLAIQALNTLSDASKEQGLTTLSIVNADAIAKGEGYHITHEVFHAGQAAIGEWLKTKDPEARALPFGGKLIHDSEWARTNPYISQLLMTRPELMDTMALPGTNLAAADLLAIELPAYINKGQWFDYFENSDDAFDYMDGYLSHLAERHTAEALNILSTTSRPDPEISDLMKEVYARFTTAGPGQISTSIANTGGDLSGHDQERVAARREEEDLKGAYAGATGSLSTRGSERDANLERFWGRSQIRKPLYHGTQSPREIAEIDFSKLDPGALYGPGFYMTQDPEVAAGEEGSYATVKRTVVDSDKKAELTKDVFQDIADRLGIPVEGSRHPKIAIQYKLAEIAQQQGFESLEVSKIEEAVRDGDRKVKDYVDSQQAPHGYQLYANIQRPFDIDASITEELRQAYRAEMGDTPPPSMKGDDFYKYALEAFGQDKKALNDFLQSQGYDGITHMGGIERPSKTFNSLQEAKSYADEVGGSINEIQWNNYPTRIIPGRWLIGSSSNDNTGRYIHVDGRDEFTDLEEAQQIAQEAAQHPTYQVIGHKVWIAFPNAQVKSATGNIGTFDPEQSSISLSTTPEPLKVGDKVRKKMGNGVMADVGEIIEIDRDEDGEFAIVDFNGKEDEVYLDRLVKDEPKAKTPAAKQESLRPSNNEKQKALLENPIVSEVESRQPSLPGIPAPKRLKATPTLPESRQPQLPGLEEPPILFKEHITPEVIRAVTQGFRALLQTGGIRVDPTKRIFLQVHEAVMAGKIDPKNFIQLLDENALSIEDFVNELDETASEAGRILGEYGRTARYSVKFMKDNPELAKQIIPNKVRMEAILQDIESGILGRSLLNRMTGLAQGMILSDQLIAFRNIFTTLKRIPIMGSTQALAAWVEAINTGSHYGQSYEDRLALANQRSLEALEPVAQILAHMTPPQLRRYLKMSKGSGKDYSEAIIQLKKNFPHLEAELVVPGFANEGQEQSSIQEATENVTIAGDILSEMRVDVKEREQFERRFNKAERRLQSNIKGLGKALRVAEWPIEQLMKPMNIAEKFFRHPTFYGHLTAELKKKNWDIAEAIQYEKIDEATLTSEQKSKRFRNIPEEDLKSAIDEALYFTHAYMPRSENSQAENMGRQIIKVLNWARPVAPATNIWFGRALYNGLKFTYEYVPLIPLLGGVPLIGPLATATALPLGMMGSAKRILFPKYFKPVKGEEMIENPIRPNDYKKFASGIIGTILYATANALLEGGGGGDEWWQIRTGMTGKNGEPLFWDIRGDQPLANWVRVADLSKRSREGRLNDIKFSQEMIEIFTGLSKGTPEMGEALDGLMEMWADGDEPKESMSTNAGRRVSFLTKPFVNIRNTWAIFNEEENKRKDLKGTGFLGPLIDNLPYFRRSLPDLSPPTQNPPVLISEYPATQFFPGTKLVEGENFAGREWKRLGLFNSRFLQPDPDPKVNRDQNTYFRLAVTTLGKTLEENAHYKSLDDIGKAAIWEYYISGDGGLASEAKEYGIDQNMVEQYKRDIREDSGQGPLQRKASGLEEKIRSIRPPELP